MARKAPKKDAFQPPARKGKGMKGCSCCGGSMSPGHKCPPGMERRK